MVGSLVMLLVVGAMVALLRPHRRVLLSDHRSTLVIIRVPVSLIELDDEFPDGEQHYRVPNVVIQRYLVAD